jgi:hypothetical protein
MQKSYPPVSLTTFLIAALLPPWTGSHAQEKLAPKAIETFMAGHCYDCHDDTTSKGDLNLLDLTFEPEKRINFAIWKRIFERVESGEMPPKKKERPEAEKMRYFLEELEKPLLAADLTDRKVNGRAQVRRMTRVEYENTVHDLLGIDLPLQELLPEDAVTHGFETVASGQQLSQHNLGRFLEAADLILDAAFDRTVDGDETFVANLTPAQLTKQGNGNYRGPELRDGKSIAWTINQQFYGRMYATELPKSGWYRVTLKDVEAINTKEGDAVWGTLRSGECASNAPILYPVGIVEATKQKRDLSFDAWIRGRHLLELKPNDVTLKRTPTGAGGGNVSYKGRDLVKQGFQGIAVSGIQIERIYPNATLNELKAKLFPGLVKEDFEKLKMPDLREPVFKKVITNFASRAFRRPVTNAQVAPYVELAMNAMKEGKKQARDGIRAAYQAILCSPRLLTFVENAGYLDNHALASRLSYALWNSMPDQALRSLADTGKLSDPEVYHNEITRLLNHPKAERFINSFTDQWLNLKEINFTAPDERMFRTFDKTVQDSMVAETRGFVREVILKNYSIRNFVQSDFAMLNERLSRFYNMKVPVKAGEGLQKVSLGKTIGRSGLITQGAVLKVTANGTTTSPVIRGVWVGERILGLEIPPPPESVPAVEPDIRGAVSIRDQLEKHKNSDSCAACHVNIDPPGFALESYDPVGLWRERYGKGKNAAKVDPSGVTPEGEAFANFNQWKQIYLNKPDQLTRGFAKQFLTYATGGQPRFCDRAAIEKIVAQSREKDYRMRSIMHAILGSETFRTK